MPLNTPRNRKSDGPGTSRDKVMTVGPGRLRTGVKRTPGRPPTRWSDFFTKALIGRNVRLTRLLWLGTGRDAIGARSRKSKINESKGDTGEVFERNFLTTVHVDLEHSSLEDIEIAGWGH
ncbi:unnamed protein product [Haemonchus placei]|uniref:Uncharacterized protein n=1 Tax=Haemonchus placei TaxID=6290 RepID=A0A0N4WFE2_HAEPC|nr:unnamed protein product [Haemonchus placei]